jgi:hypothetical protein
MTAFFLYYDTMPKNCIWNQKMNHHNTKLTMGASPIALMASTLLVMGMCGRVGAGQPDDATTSTVQNPSTNEGGRQNVRRNSKVPTTRMSIDDQVRSLTKRLALTEAQQSDVMAILVRRDGKAQQIRTAPGMSALDRGHALQDLNSESVAQIKALLSPEQLRSYGTGAHSAPE